MPPSDGDRPGVERGFRLKVCGPCRAGDHGNCRPILERAPRRLFYCECLGWARVDRELIVLPCIPAKDLT